MKLVKLCLWPQFLWTQQILKHFFFHQGNDPPSPRWLASVLGEIPLVSLSENLSLLWAVKPEERSGAATWGLKGASYGSNRFEEAFKSKGSFVKCEWFFSEIVPFKLEMFLCGAVVVQPFHPMDYVDYGGFHIKYLLNWWHTMSQCFCFFSLFSQWDAEISTQNFPVFPVWSSFIHYCVLFFLMIALHNLNLTPH